MSVKISDSDIKKFLDWANRRAFCNSGQHIVDRIATTFECSIPVENNKPEPKPLAQYLAEYIEYEWSRGEVVLSITVFKEQIRQALDAYESTEGVKIRIEKI